jgi:hypothetical protein
MARNLTLGEEDVKRIALRLFQVMHEELKDYADMQSLLDDVEVIDVNQMDFNEYAQLMLAVLQHMTCTLMFRNQTLGDQHVEDSSSF